MTVPDVLNGSARWGIHTGDCLPWLESLPDACVNLMVTSPPYEAARTYGVDFTLRGQDWVDWLVARIIQMCRVSSGLVLVNAAGQLRDHKYSPVMEWLVADLTRKWGIVCGPSPYVFFRFGIPGSGGKHYHRRDWEPVYAFCLPDQLPLKWSDNKATGHPPKYGPGGEMSNRTTGGGRVNKWNAGYKPGGTSKRNTNGTRQIQHSSQFVEMPNATPGLFGPVEEAPKNPLTGRSQGEHGNARPGGYEDAAPPKTGRQKSRRQEERERGGAAEGKEIKKAQGHKVITKPREDWPSQESTFYDEPAIANSGNVIRERYDAEQVRDLLEAYVTREIDYGDVIRCLVGGVAMGHNLAHENEAPFPVRLVEFFVASYCPPDGIVCDPFAGSGTSLHAALNLGRRAIGCDLRQSQTDVATRRLSGITGTLFQENP